MNDKLSDAWFRRLSQNADEVLRARQRATALLSERPAERFDGIGHLLGKVLPANSEIVKRFADAMGVEWTLVAQLRASELDPLHLPPPVLVLIGNALQLNEDSFLDLIWRDHERFVELQRGTVARSIGSREPGEVKRRLHEAWERAALDDPANA